MINDDDPNKAQNQLKQRFPRSKPQLNFEDAENILFSRLEHAALVFNQGPPRSREAIYGALDVIISFLVCRGLSGQALTPLLSLNKDLLSMDNGTASLYFGKNAPRSREELEATRSRHLAKDTLREYAVACSEALYANHRKEGKKRSDADEVVARAAENWPRFDQEHITAIQFESGDSRLTNCPTMIQRKQI